MHIFIRKPDRHKLCRLIEKYQTAEVTQEDVGLSKSWTSELFTYRPELKLLKNDLVQFRRTQLGTGESDYASAVAALRAGICFDLAWVNCVKLNEFQHNDTFCLLAKAFGLWTANFCRIMYVDEEANQAEKTFSIGIGTLPRHAAIGEERLAINWNLRTDEVDFLIGSYSRPGSYLAKVFDGYLRSQQNRFAEDSVERLKASVRESH